MTLPANLITGRAAKLPGDYRPQSPLRGLPAGSGLEEGFLRVWRAFCTYLPLPKHNYRFHPTRRWALDYAWPDVKLAVEIEGHYRHRSRSGFAADHKKYRAAENMGWRILKYPGDEWKARPVQIVEEVAKLLTKLQGEL